MTTAARPAETAMGWRLACWIVAAGFCAVSTAVSSARWANFQYRSFDLAYYVQGLSQLLHGRMEVSILDVPLLGNHVEPIVLLFLPFFALLQHPMVFVALQNAAIATMAPVGYDIARRCGFGKLPAFCLGTALLLTPATGFIALHEFHPEALTAPLLLLLLRARLKESRAEHWLWFAAVLACKENMAVLLVAYCTVQALVERKRDVRYLRSFYLWPMLAAVGWFVISTKVITPALNAGSIDYGSLYSHLGGSLGEALRNAVTEPQRILRALGTSLGRGSLVPGLLLPFLCLPLLRPHWLLIAAPILLQHLLSWRSSEWTIYFHYAAPLLPLFWMAAVEALRPVLAWKSPAVVLTTVSALILVACAIGQFVLGPADRIWETAQTWRSMQPERERKVAFLAAIPPQASVLAPLPYLSHLAAREHCYSLHYVLKGLKTLSRAPYEPPPPPDYVLIDYRDSATFGAAAGYYHPKMRTTDGLVVESSDRSLHELLRQARWRVDTDAELTLFTKQPGEPPAPATVPAPSEADALRLGPTAELLAVSVSPQTAAAHGTLTAGFSWRFAADRDVFPWLELAFTRESDGKRVVVTRGLCAPEIREGAHGEVWKIPLAARLAPGTYAVEALFFDNTRRLWSAVDGNTGSADPALLAPPISLRPITISADEQVTRATPNE